MHDHPQPATPEGENWADQITILQHVVASYPETLRRPEVAAVLGDPEDFAVRDRAEMAVAVLVEFGLLYRAEGTVLPTRAALRAFEIYGS